MKKLIKILFLILIALVVVGGITYAVAPKEEKDNITNIFKKPIDFIKDLFSKMEGIIDTSKLTSDNLFNEDSKTVLSINQINFNSYFTDKTLSSSKEVTKLYQDAYRTLRIFETNAVEEKLNLYINLENDLKKSMYIYVTFTFEKESSFEYDPDYIPKAKIKEIELKWYNGDLIGKYSEGITTYGKASQKLLGSTFQVTNKSKATIKLQQGGEANPWKDYDLEYIYHMGNEKVDDIVTTDSDNNLTGISVAKYTASDIQKICDSLFTDLFQIDEIKDETTAPVGEVKLISLEGLKAIADCTYNYDKAVYGKHPLNDIWDAHYREYVSQYHEDPLDMLLFAVDFLNEKTLDKKTFYLNVWADPLRDSSGNLIGDSNGLAEVYEYRNNVFHLVGIYNSKYSWVTSKEYDLTDYREWSLEQTFMFSNYKLNLNPENLLSSTAIFTNLMNINETDFPSEIMKNIFKTKERN